ncbi:MAG: PIN domain-containing protein [Pirellulales bacterium]|nr:PIN domain-containing protein [Pirellulales bacterium]
MESQFLDTSFLLALELADDGNHQAAIKYWSENVAKLPPLVTTSYVFSETVTFFNSRGFHEKAVSLGRSLLQSRRLNLIHVEESLFHQGWIFFEKHRDKRYSLTDCISFLVMRKQQIQEVLTFDRHFEQAGFRMAPIA